MKTPVEQLIEQASGLLERFENLLTAEVLEPDWEHSIAFRWRRIHTRDPGHLEAVPHTHNIQLSELQGIEVQKRQIVQNTAQFLSGLPANNVLLWGARGTGKSSLIKALLNAFADQGLRLIEVDRHELLNLPDIVALVSQRPERFILFCDDLSFEADDPSYKALKVVLDGSVSTTPENILVYATSNRRHLLPEYMEENQHARRVKGEIHPSEAAEEKIALSDRFGLWLSFYPFDHKSYITIVKAWLNHYGVAPELREQATEAALQWALLRGSRSGRTAWQFARDFAGRHGLNEAS
ncbi:ATP-binding protein [Nitrosococcus wardiae]|uniref:ATP-binding protein n=1 Tax=Nitrosococcus wardiae TaxID=1814290 RepID=A0A4P7C0F6_9GAMM|nr:ATP-binding protein [Nitrosococcus wardiae]QBQ55010.1 ATP-binding protein [Nitrosococcus wardiae]